MPSDADRALIVSAFQTVIWPSGAPTLDDAWLGIYQMLLYYEHDLPHVCEANELRRKPWATRARRAEQYLASALGIRQAQLSQHVDQLMHIPRWQGMQRHNPVGHGFRTLVCHVIRTWGSQTILFEQELDATRLFPGITLPGRSDRPAIDITGLKNYNGQQKPRGVISCKWMSRHDRSSDPTNECPSYRNAANSLYVPQFAYVVVTSEMGASRIGRFLSQPCIDYVVHPSRAFFEAIDSPGAAAVLANPRFVDLADFTRATATW